MFIGFIVILLAATTFFPESEATPSYRQFDGSFKCDGFPGLSKRDSDKCLIAKSITEPLESGMGFRLFGFVTADPIRIDIDLIKGDSERPAIPLHLSIRFKEGKIVYNRYQHGSGWSGEEQRIPLNFRAKRKLDLRVHISNSGYAVYGNGYVLGGFKSIMSLDGVDHVSISGDLKEQPIFVYGSISKIMTPISKIMNQNV